MAGGVFQPGVVFPARAPGLGGFQSDFPEAAGAKLHLHVQNVRNSVARRLGRRRRSGDR